MLRIPQYYLQVLEVVHYFPNSTCIKVLLQHLNTFPCPIKASSLWGHTSPQRQESYTILQNNELATGVLTQADITCIWLMTATTTRSDWWREKSDGPHLSYPGIMAVSRVSAHEWSYRKRSNGEIWCCSNILVCVLFSDVHSKSCTATVNLWSHQ